MKSAVVEAFKGIFGPTYSDPDFQNLYVSIEYPDAPQAYPGIWVNYTDSEELIRAGIDQREVVQDDQGGFHEVTRWRFGGEFSFTIAAFSSLERDRLFDEVVRVLAFTNVEPESISFKQRVEANPFVGVNLNYDELKISGEANHEGTPWNSQDEWIYEITVSSDCIGEFVSDPQNNALVPLSKVLVQGYRDGTPVPDFPDVPPVSGVPFSPTNWH